MKKAILALLFFTVVIKGFAQTDGDYQSRVNGIWNQPSTWEVWVGGTWRPLNSASAGVYQNILPSSSSGVITLRHIVTVTNATALIINQTVIQASARLIINTGRTVQIQDDLSQTPLTLNAGGFIVNSGVLDLQSQLTVTPCQINGFLASNAAVLCSNPALLRFNSGSTYQHSNRTGGNIPLATWNINSTCHIFGLNAPNPSPPNNLWQSFGNFLWNTPNMGFTTNFSLFGLLRTVNGNLTIQSTGAVPREVRLDSGGPGTTLTVGGNLVIQGGIFTLSQGQTTATNVTIGGNFIMSGGTLNLGIGNNQAINVNLNGNFQKTGGVLSRGTGNGPGGFRFDGGLQTYQNNQVLTSPVHFSVQSGSTVDFGSSFLTGPGNFTLLSGGTINVGSIDALGAIQLGTSGGNIRMSGLRTYQTGSTIVYNGTGTQGMGDGHPSTANTTIDNGDSVYMVSSVTINGTLTLQNGVLVIANNTLTLGGTVSYPGGFMGITSLSNVVINGSGNFGSLILAPVESSTPPNAMNNLTINRTGGGTVELGLDLIVGGTFTHTAGTFLIGQAPGWSLTLRGPFNQSSGVLSLFDNPIFIVEGAGAMPANVNITGTGFEKLTMNRAATFSTTSPLIITDSLNLLNGTVSHPSANMTMGTDATVLRTGGTVTQILDAEASYEVVYAGSANITTGNELPFITPVTTRLSNLRKLGTGTVTLNHEIIVNGNFSIEEGTFDVATGNDVGIGGNLVADGTFLTQESNVAFLGSTPQTISGVTSPIAFFDLTVAQVASTTLSLSTNITVANNLAINSGSTFDVGTNRMRLLSTPTRTANVNALPTGASIVGSVIVDRHLPKADPVAGYFHMASPVVSSTITDWKNEVPSILAAYKYNEPTASFVPYSLNGALQSGQGYFIYVNSPNATTPDVRGTLRQGNISVPLTSQSSNLALKGFNLVGNPYPSAISWLNIGLPGDGSIDNAVYITDNFNNSGQGSGTHDVSFVDGVSIPAGFTGEISQGQAFWVRANVNTTINFTEAAKITATNTQFYRVGEIPDVLRISLRGIGKESETVLRLREGATTKFDPKYDAQKFFQSDLSLSTLTTDNVNTVINAFSLDNCVGSIPLVPVVPASGSYSFSFQGLESFDAKLTITLTDTEENKIVDVHKIKDYHFTVADEKLANLANRFRISFQGKEMISAPAVALTVDETTLFSSVTEGNQWYFNDVLLEGETSEKLVAFDPGIYTVKITQGGCTSEASHEVSEEDLNIYPAISVYPNPARDKIWTRVKSENNNISVVLVNSAGMEIETKQLVGEGNVKEGEFNMIPHASGIYYLKILDGTKMFIRKVAKVK